MTQTKKRLILHWATPANLLTILSFMLLAIILEFVLITFSIPASLEDSAIVIIPFTNVSISLMYHLLPITIIIILTASFTNLATNIAQATSRTKSPVRTPQKKIHGPTRLKILRKYLRRGRLTLRKTKQKILKTLLPERLQKRAFLVRAKIKSALIIAASFSMMVLLITIVAYPKLVPTITMDFYNLNTSFLDFVIGTIKASENIANAIPPIGILGASIHNALIAAAPAFRNTLESAASAVTKGLVSLNPTEKYLIIQNTAAWIVAILTLSYNQFVKIRRTK
ncbi:MAG: hypothetical protein JSV05_09680 [Candidatus Bathyarchaeota archaeon]|nr:MAG: hypothetical protein JSV05_09680 [Candidatus Bathyarchaeota archaeon]